MAKNKKGKDKAEYPKLIRLDSGKKVRVLSEADEATYTKKEPKKDAAWGKDK